MKSVKIILLAILIAAAQGLWADSMREVVRKGFPAKGIETVEINSTNGSIVVMSWDKDSISIIARKKVDGSGEKARALLQKIRVITNRQGRTLKISAKVPESKRRGLWSLLFGMGIKNYSVNWEIRVPATMDVKAYSTNGDIELDDLQGTIDISTTNGSINALRISNLANFQSTNGEIHIYFNKLPKEGDIDVGTTNGEIELVLPSEARCKINAYSTNGKINCNLAGMEKIQHSSREFSTVVHGGGVNISLGTTNGDISISSK